MLCPQLAHTCTADPESRMTTTYYAVAGCARIRSVALDNATLVGFVGTADLERAHAFYGGALGLPLVESNGFANVYDAGGTQLRVTLVREPVAAGYTVLGWVVSD